MLLAAPSPNLGFVFLGSTDLKLVEQARGRDPEGYRAEFYKIVEMSQLLAGKRINL